MRCRDRCHAWYLMSTCVRPLARDSRDSSPPLYVQLCNLNHLCIEPFSSASRRLLSLFHSLPLVQGKRSVLLANVGRPRFGLAGRQSGKKDLSIVEWKGSRGIACPKPFISMSNELRPSRLVLFAPIRSGDDIMKKLTASGKPVDVSISKYRSVTRYPWY